MNPCAGKLRVAWMRDRWIVLAIGLAAAGAAWWYYHGPGNQLIDMNPGDCQPAALWAAGYGFSNAVDRPAALDAFLTKRADRLNPDDLPQSMRVVPARTKNDIDRIYLLYAIGMVWRLFGIDWQWLSVLPALGAGATLMLLYGLFRLGMGRVLSLAGAVLAMTSPLMLVMLPCLRDFWKGPPILATFLGAGYLLSRPVRTGTLLLLALGLGLAAGIGYGIRQDCIICVPPALFAVACLAHRNGERFRFPVRIVAAAIFLASFLIPAFPVFQMIQKTGGTNGLYVLQGHALYCESNMGVRRAWYASMAQTDDAYVDACARVYATRSGLGGHKSGMEVWEGLQEASQSFSRFFFWKTATAVACGDVVSLSRLLVAMALPDPGTNPHSVFDESEYADRRLFFYLTATFPADAIARCYAATVHIVHGMRGYAATPTWVNPFVGTRGNPDNRVDPKPTWYSIHQMVERHLERYGEFYALTALVILSLRSSWTALVALGLVMYFCGYTGLYFQERHAYHLEFVAFWFPAFCLARAAHVACVLPSRERRRQMLLDLGWSQHPSLPFKHVFAFLLIAVIALSVPLGAARLWQQTRVEELSRLYRYCDLDPIPFDEKVDSDGTAYFAPPPLQEPSWLIGCLYGPQADKIFGLLHDYYVAEFDAPKSNGPLTMRVLYRDCMFDCVCSLRDDFDPGPGAGGRTVRYFFPAFQFTGRHEVGHLFKGFQLPPGATLKQLYRVRDQEKFMIPMNAWLVEGEENSRWYKAIALFGTWI